MGHVIDNDVHLLAAAYGREPLPLSKGTVLSSFNTSVTSASEEGIVISVSGRVTADNAADLEKSITDQLAELAPAPLTLDFEGLEYVSSAGLRVIMRLAQKDKSLVLANVSPEVYDILDMTGFTEILDVRRRMRDISVEGCEIVGAGGNGTVYRLDEDTIVKVYKPWMKLEAIQRERDFAKTAFINGVPSVIAYDVVRVGDCLGVVFEMIKSDTLGHTMRDNPDKLEELVDKYVELARTLHATHVDTDSFTDIHEVLHERADNLGQWCTPEEIAVLHGIIDSIPHADTLTHNDLHPGNIMVQDGELLLIDMPDVTLAPPICDLVSIYRDMISAPQNQGSIIEGSVGMPADLILKVGNLFFQKYTGITDEEQLQAYYQRLGLIYAFNVALMPGAASANSMKFADAIMNNLLRPVVIPNEQAIRGLLQTM